MSAYKFRAWHKTVQIMIPWEHLQNLMKGVSIRGGSRIEVSTDNRMRIGIPREFEIAPCDPFAHPDLVIMQTTELTDVDGQEIYEGDRVINLTHYGIVATMKRKNLLAGPAIAFEAEEMGIRHWIDARLLVVGNEFEKSTRKA